MPLSSLEIKYFGSDHFQTVLDTTRYIFCPVYHVALHFPHWKNFEACVCWQDMCVVTLLFGFFHTDKVPTKMIFYTVVDKILKFTGDVTDLQLPQCDTNVKLVLTVAVLLWLNEGSDFKNKANNGDKFTNMVIPKLLLRFHLFFFFWLRFHLNSRSAQLEPLPSLGMAENKKYSYIIEYMHFFNLG